VVSYQDRPQSNHAHLTVLQYYNMHADITQENNLTHMHSMHNAHYIAQRYFNGMQFETIT